MLSQMPSPKENTAGLHLYEAWKIVKFIESKSEMVVAGH